MLPTSLGQSWSEMDWRGVEKCAVESTFQIVNRNQGCHVLRAEEGTIQTHQRKVQKRAAAMARDCVCDHSMGNLHHYGWRVRAEFEAKRAAVQITPTSCLACGSILQSEDSGVSDAWFAQADLI